MKKFLFVSALAALPAFAGHQVVTTALDSTAGSLRAAVDSAKAGDTVVFNIPGKDTVVIKDSITLGKNIVILGGVNLATKNRVVVTVDTPGVSRHRVFVIVGGTIVIHGLVMAGGNVGTAAGGVIKAVGKAVIHLDSVDVSGGTSGDGGGGIYNQSDSLILSNSDVNGNSCRSSTAGASGGGINHESGVLIIINSRIRGNSVVTTGFGVLDQGPANGGGLFAYIGIVHIDKTVIDSNGTGSSYSAAQGGGLFNLGAVMTLANTSIIGNSSAVGGGVYNGNTGTVKISTSMIASNSVASSGPNGGGVHNDGLMEIDRTMVSRNSSYGTPGPHDSWGASSSGGGINNYGYCTIQNSTLYGNSSYGTGSMQTDWGGSSVGGGLCNQQTMVIINSTIFGNSSYGGSGDAWGGDSRGGGIYNKGAVLTMAYTTIGGDSSRAGNGNPYKGSASGDEISGNVQSMVNSVIFGGCDGTIAVQENSIGAGPNDLFRTSSPVLSDNGGPTLTIALDSSSLARGAGVHAGIYGKDTLYSGSSGDLIKLAYSNGATWHSLETDSVIPAATIVTEIKTDQRGVDRAYPPCIGAFEFIPNGAQARRIPVVNKVCQRICLVHNTLRITFASATAATIEMYNLSGATVYSHSVNAGPGACTVILPRLAPGPLLCRVTSPLGSMTRKVILQR